MPTEIIIDSQKYWNQLKNGSSFGDNLSDYTNNLVGSIGERIKVETQLSVYCHAITTPTPWDLSTPGYVLFTYVDALLQLTRNTGDFTNSSGGDGLSAGDTVSIWHMDTGGVYHGPYNGTIASISATQIIFTSSPIDSGSTPLTDGVRQWMDIVCTSWLTALIFKFGLIGNNETFNDYSKVSLNEQCYYGSGIGADNGSGVRLTTDVTLQRLGNYNDWISGSAKISYVSTTGNCQKFKITHEFIVAPWYIKEWEQNLIDQTTPVLLSAPQSIKYAISTEFRTLLSNPNTAKKSIEDNILGCIGFFNVNFNGFNNIYKIDSIDYIDSTSTASVAGLQVASKTKATITLSKLIGTFNSGDAFSVFVSYCPDDTSKYQNTLSTLEYNFNYDNAINTEGSASVSGANSIIKTCIANIATGKLVIEAEFEYTSTQQMLMQNSPKYLIGVCIADKILSSGSSDKVMLLADYNDMALSSDIPDLMGVIGEGFKFDILRHDLTASTQHTLWDEDGVYCRYKFWLDTALKAKINSLDFCLVAYKNSTETYFILDKKSLNISSAPIVNGVQILYVNNKRGYELDTADDFNKITLALTGGLVGTKQYYILKIGQKIKWQDWIPNTLADTDFYNYAELNNNLNYKSDNYCSLQSGNTDYSIRVMLIANVSGINSLGVSGTTIYQLISPEQFIYDYNTDRTTNPQYWTALIETFDKTGTINLGGSILTNDYTLFRTTFTFYSALNATATIWSIHRIEEQNELGDQIFEHSTLYDRIIKAPFIDQVGSTIKRLMQTINTGTNTVITENLIDYNKLSPNKKYKLSSRINYIASSILPEFKITEDSIIKETEDGIDFKIIE